MIDEVKEESVIDEVNMVLNVHRNRFIRDG